MRGKSIHNILPTRSLSTELTVQQVNDSQAILSRDVKPSLSPPDNAAELQMESALEQLSLTASRSDTGSRSSSEKQFPELRVSEEPEVCII